MYIVHSKKNFKFILIELCIPTKRHSSHDEPLSQAHDGGPFDGGERAPKRPGMKILIYIYRSLQKKLELCIPANRHSSHDELLSQAHNGGPFDGGERAPMNTC